MSQKGNSHIRKRVIWYIAAMLTLIALVMMAQYSITGTVAVCSGAVIGIMIAKIRQITAGYEYYYPLWFRSLLIFTGIFVIFGGMIGCRELSKLIYNVSDGIITPFYLFLIIVFLMISLFMICYRKNKLKNEKSSRIYSFLMLFAVCMVIAQCSGSMLHNSALTQEQWLLGQENIIETPLYHEEDVIGTWIVTNGMDVILGVKPTEETFQADGSWQTGSHDGILSQGRWTLKNDVIEVHQTIISVGSTREPTDNVMTYSIINLTTDQMECKRGEYTILLQRKK